MPAGDLIDAETLLVIDFKVRTEPVVHDDQFAEAVMVEFNGVYGDGRPGLVVLALAPDFADRLAHDLPATG